MARGSVVFIWLTTFLGVGCSPPEYCRLSGVVEFRGKPVPDLQITLRPVLVDSVREAIAITDRLGRFELTHGRMIGVKRGEYFVAFEDPGAPEGRQSSSDSVYQELIRVLPSGNQLLRIAVLDHQDDFRFDLERFQESTVFLRP